MAKVLPARPVAQTKRCSEGSDIMYILGLNSGYRVPNQDAPPGWSDHDAAAALLRDGEIIAAIEEERLDRIKHSSHFPHEAIKACLSVASLRPEEVDIVALNVEGTTAHQPYRADLQVTLSALFQKYVGDMRRAKLRFVNHQLAHLFSAWIPSGFDECLCLSLDGLGDGASGAVGLACNDRIEVIRTMRSDQSLGEFYSDCIRVLGYDRFDEYKVMALAALGSPSAYEELFAAFYDLQEDGDYALVAAGQRWRAITRQGIRQRRSASEPFTQAHCDFAASLQAMMKDVVRHILSYFRRTTGLTKLAAAGGVMHNSAVNGSILASGLFDRVFVQPAAHDAGGALGAAYAAYHTELPLRSDERRLQQPRFNLQLGRALSDRKRLVVELESWSSLVEVEPVDNPLGSVAEALDQGKIIGWVQGRSEFGPRALGNRSILADPRCVAARERINRIIKQREAFRPFAPAVLVEEVWSVFERTVGTADLDYMTFLLKMKPDRQKMYPAVVHADGTSRVQTVCHENSPRFHALISRFRELTGTPLVLNTSFNARGEPIVDSIDDAVACFLLTGLDLLVVDDVLVRSVPGALTEAKIDTLRISLPSSRKIVHREIPGNVDGQRRFFLETTFSRHFGGDAVPLCEKVSQLLMLADGNTTIGQLCKDIGCARDLGPVCVELVALWRRGHVRMRGVGAGAQRVCDPNPG